MELVKHITCYHCGEVCTSLDFHIDKKYFCCQGCKLVYEILSDKDLCSYYQFEDRPGNTPKTKKFQFLDNENIKPKLLNFSDGKSARVTFYLPDMHCSSCVWLLESLFRINSAISHSRVNFQKKQISITFDETKTSLRNIAELLTSLGYEPVINLDSLEQKHVQPDNKELYIKIGLTGFCFANIMLLSFPAYLSSGNEIEPQFMHLFGILNLLLALPVFFYSSLSYYKSAVNGLKQKLINMDVPISLGIITLFMRSLYEILMNTGSGYMDSFTGLVFLLLIGKLFEKKTYDTLSFDRDYKSYFPISVTIKEGSQEKFISLQDLKVGDRMIIRNQEIIPADSIMINGESFIDYSFVTGESTPVKKVSGEVIYAGGRQIGSAVEVDVIKDVSHSYLTQLWNDDAFNKIHQSKIINSATLISRYFTFTVLLLAITSAIYWLPVSLTLALNAFTAVLIVACPCALALSTPFTLGNALRIFGKNQFYIKSASIIEALAHIDVIVFDKTGTLTRNRFSNVKFVSHSKSSESLISHEKKLVRSLVRHSSHPLSQQIYTYLSSEQDLTVNDFKELPGEGIEGKIADHSVKLGSYDYILPGDYQRDEKRASVVYLSIDEQPRGYFKIVNNYRKGLAPTISTLMKNFKLFLLSGDNDNERKTLFEFFKNNTLMKFKQTPFDKLKFIKQLQRKKKRVLMIGDGLNDAGALQQSDVGISISDNINAFSPASDAILKGQQFNKLPEFLNFAKISVRIIITSFVISFFYNLVGLSFAMQGTLSPLIAAILMPLSSISVIVFTTGATTFFARKKGL